MSLLSVVPGGSVIGLKKSVGSREQRDKDDLRQKILDSLLPAQLDFCDDHETKILGLVAGFGSGKTRALCAKAILKCAQLEAPGFADLDGNILARAGVGAGGVDAYEGYYRMYMDVYCERPNANGVLTGITF